MPNTAPSISHPSLIMWLLATGTMVLAVHVGHGWIRRARGRSSPRDTWRPLLLAAAAVGSGLCASMVLALTAETLGFPLGYRAVYVPLLWLASVLAALAVVWAMAGARRWWALAAAGVGLAVVAAAVQAAWLLAAGFLPGLEWRVEYVATGVALAALLCAAGTWAALSEAVDKSRHKRLRRTAAAVVIAFGLMIGDEVLMVGAGLQDQVGSAWLRQVPGSLLSLLCVLVPITLAMMELDLYLRRPQRKHSDLSNRFAPRRRRRQRHRTI